MQHHDLETLYYRGQARLLNPGPYRDRYYLYDQQVYHCQWRDDGVTGWGVIGVTPANQHSGVPTISLELTLDTIGYELRVSVEGQEVVEECRDFGASHDVVLMTEYLVDQIVDAVRYRLKRANWDVPKLEKRQ